jgi:anti-sigma B factor antagonist
MELLLESLPDGVTRVILNGRLDIQGAEKIDLPFSTLSSHRKVIVDLSKVTFLASMGIRTIVLTARSVKSKGGAMVLLDPTADVENVLLVSGIDTLIPVVHGMDAAIAALG